MKKTVLYAALLTLFNPVPLFALGLGEMTVESALDQQFNAQIELVDAGGIILTNVKVDLADPDNFQRAGVDYAPVLSALKFKIERNKHGKAIIRVQSSERISDPYFELVLDLTWPAGQLYRTYTVLLDPPGYQLATSPSKTRSFHHKASHHHVKGDIDKEVTTQIERSTLTNHSAKKDNHASTARSENVWQIAQRYKTSHVSLPQVVLGIVGANPEAFKGGNLNGLKDGLRLNIPSSKDMQQIPNDLATEEIMAHDKAWNDKTLINHVLTPPYLGGQAAQQQNAAAQSEIPSLPVMKQKEDPSASALPQLMGLVSLANTSDDKNPKPLNNNKAVSREMDSSTKAEISVTTAAVESMRESNTVLTEQLHLIQAQNKMLQQQLEKREKDIESIRTQMQALMKERMTSASQANASSLKSESSSAWPLFFLLALVGGCGGGAFWYLKRRDQDHEDDHYLAHTAIDPKGFVSPEKQAPLATHIPQSTVTIVENKKIETNKNDKLPVETLAVMETASEHKEAEQQATTEQTLATKKPSAKKTKNKVSESETSEEQKLEKPAQEKPVVATDESLKNNTQKPEEKLPVVTADKAIEDNNNPIDFKAEPAPTKIETVQEKPLFEAALDDAKSEEGNHETQELLEFESGLINQLQEKKEQTVEKSNEVKKIPTPEENAESGAIDFISGLAAETQQQNMNKEDAVKPIPKEESKEPEHLDEIPLDFQLEETTPPKPPVIKEVDLEVDPSISDFFAETKEDVKGQKAKDKQSTKKGSKNKEQPEENVTDDKTDAPTNPLKNKQALDTLISLAKTYIGMDDFETARNSLEEVLEHGSESQKVEAQQLLDEIKNK